MYPVYNADWEIVVYSTRNPNGGPHIGDVVLPTPLVCGSLGEIHGFTFIGSPRMTPFERWLYRKDRLALNRRKKQRRATTGRR